MKLRLSLVAAVLLVSTSMAQAIDRKSYPGSTCQPVNPNTPFSIITGQGFIQNTSAAAVQYDCPIVRDEVLMNLPIQVQAFVNDNSAASSVTCTSFSVDPTGAIVDFDTQSTPVAGVGLFVLNMNVAPTGPGVGNAYHMLCNVQPVAGGVTSQVRTYFVTENEQFD